MNSVVRFTILFAVTGLGLTLSGCADLAYYRQTVAGQWELLQARRPVAAVLADPATTPALRRRLETAQALRRFASTELGLPDNGSYRSYADLKRPQAVKNVFAAPELALALTAAGIAHAARIGAQVATIGLPAGHAWLAPVRRRFRAIEYQTQLHIAYWPEAAPAVAALDPAPAFPDVALL